MLAALVVSDRSGCSVVDTEPSRSRTWRGVSSWPSFGVLLGVRNCTREIDCFGCCLPRRGGIGGPP